MKKLTPSPLEAILIQSLRLACLLAVAAAPLSTRAAGLIASDRAEFDEFGYSVSQSETIGLVGAYLHDTNGNNVQGAAYLFRNLDTAIGTQTENVRLIASDGAANNGFGVSVSQSGNLGVVGSSGADIGGNFSQGSAYVFRNLDTVTGTITESVKLIASDGAVDNNFGFSVSQSGNIAMVGAIGADSGPSIAEIGAAYVFRNLNTATGTVTQNVKLMASDGAGGDRLGQSVSLSGSIGLVAASEDDFGANIGQGSAYVFRNLDTATGTIMESVKLFASDGAGDDSFGYGLSLSGNIALIGAVGDDNGANTSQGSAYIFRNLATATGTKTEDVKLMASDGAARDFFGFSVSQSGNVGLVGAYGDTIGSNDQNGSAYIYRNLDTATGTKTENVKVTASVAGNNNFGISVSLDGDQFIIGANRENGVRGKAYSGSVSSVTTLDAGSTNKIISGISFTSRDDWEIGVITDSNQVTLSAGDTANVTAAGRAVFIGKNAGSDNNTLIVAGTAIANQITVGATGNTGNRLTLNGSVTAANGTFVFSGSAIGGDGILTGNLSLLSGGKFVFSFTETLTVTGTVSLTTTFGIDDLIGLDSSADTGTYTLIDGTGTNFATLGLENWGAANAYDLGDGKFAYFKQGSLQVEVIPEPSTWALLGMSALFLTFLRRPGKRSQE